MPPTVPPAVPCDGDLNEGWIKKSGDDEFCYKITTSSSDTDTWEKAEYDCLMEVL